jgi:hypothetical protein
MWYLVGLPSHKNLGDAIEEYLKHHPFSIPAPPQAISETRETLRPPAKNVQKKQERLSKERFERKQEIVEKVREMHQQGISGHGIAAE